MKLSEKKEAAERLYVYNGLTQKEIAHLVKVTPHTVGNWARKDNWKEKKGARLITKDKVLSNTYKDMATIHETAESEGRPLSNAEVDRLAKLAKQAKMFSDSIGLPQRYGVMAEFLEFLEAEKQSKRITYEQAQFAADLTDMYISNRNKK